MILMKDIIKEGNPILRQKCCDVEFPLTETDEKTIKNMIEYLINSQDDELANKYNKTQNQILLNYYVKEKSIIPITKANKIEHIRQNLEALNFEMEQQDYQRLNDFRCEEFDNLEVDWLDNGGIPIYKFANQVE